ncbi:hypothetical protein SAMN02745216_03905 [Desulfatibacillum alkenivorans DSM 16219]|jgi:hypothetical protein|uniref:Uncharacterized protein n=1 Tax=Desulfatibacillum alkenivorans DSM 16219 TaxID=1121393 RepID=A0A1M6UH38_9BACT|nr:hypothetical protein SAMN02745216_03905 [Desulfatibacillum alkenivorans DSM 16219]
MINFVLKMMKNRIFWMAKSWHRKTLSGYTAKMSVFFDVWDIIVAFALWVDKEGLPSYIHRH